MMAVARRFALVGALALAGCGAEEPDGLMLELLVGYPSGLDLDRLALSAALPMDPPRMMQAEVPSEPRPLADTGETVVLALPETLTESFELSILGYSGPAMRARAQLTVGAGQAQMQVMLQPSDACETPPCNPDGGLPDGAVADAADAGVPADAEPEDSGDDPADAEPSDGPAADADPRDAGVEDAPAPDGALADATPTDAALADADPADAEPTDLSTWDAAPGDAEIQDAMPSDATPPDTSVLDSGSFDAGFVDATAPDATAPDASAPDAAPADTGVTPDAGSTTNPPSKLVFLGVPTSMTAGACVPVVLQRQTQAGIPSRETITRRAALNTTQGGSFALHSDPACSTMLLQATLPAGTSEIPLYALGTAAGPATVVATTASLSPATLSTTVVGAEPLGVAVVGGPTSLVWGTCTSPAVQLELRDAFGNVATNSLGHTVELTTTPPGAIVFGTVPSCSTPRTSQHLPAGQASVPLKLMGLRVGTFTVRVAGNGLAGAQTMLTVADATAGCASCGASTGPCADSCTNSNNCNVSCRDGCSCQTSCVAGANRCSPRCGLGSTCMLDCRNQTNCQAACQEGSSCVVECDGATTCNQVDCRGTASCMLACGNATTCAFRTCAAGQMTCPSNITVCNRACP